MKRPAILTYHGLTKTKSANSYLLEEKSFHDQLKTLSSNGYQCVLVDEYYRYLTDPAYLLPPKSVLITFDDGHESDYSIALPLLKRFQCKATFFVTTGWIGTSGYMNASQLLTLKNEGMSVQSHAKTHSFLDKLSIQDMATELSDSQKLLEDILGATVSFISFPGGRYNRAVIQCAQDSNYSAALSSEPFRITRYEKIYLMGRYGIKQTLAGRQFEKIAGGGVFLQVNVRLSYGVKYLLKKTLGDGLYYALWKKYTGK